MLTLDVLPFQLRRSPLGLTSNYLDMIRTMKVICSNDAFPVNGSSGRVYSQGLQQ
jgi:hypothetical protein